jgi:integrase
MASLIKRGDTWTVVYLDASGKRKWVSGYASKPETQRLADRLEDEKRKIRTGEIDPLAEARRKERSKPITEHVAGYKAHLEAKGSSGNHVAYTIADIEKLMAFGGVKQAGSITWGLIDKWVLSLKEKDSARTINRRIGSVQAFLRHLQQQGGVSEYTLIKYPKQQTRGKERRRRRALSQSECNLLLACEQVPEDRRLIYRFAILTGFRFSEVGSMMPSSFRFDQKTITVSAADAKNKKRDQVVPMHPDLIEPLHKLCEDKDRYARVFVMPSRTEAAKTIREDCKLAGVDVTHVDFHALRHTFVTLLAESGVHPKVLQSLARHSTLETTLRYYTHFKQADERSAVSGLLKAA